jgi:type II secretory pathway pseudopilin PulG
MKPITKQSDKKTAFTIIELLTVMSIIVILIGLLVPSLNMVKRYSKEVKQRAQFHSIESALEFFSSDSEYGRYPPSSDATTPHYCGAMKLCEAMMGQDLMGFHPLSSFREDCTDGTNKLYDNNPTGDTLYPDPATNLRARKGPYLQLENANAYRMGQLYPPQTTFDTELFVLCDVYNRVRNVSTGKGVGMPILYYKANTANIIHDPCGAQLPTATDDYGYIYNAMDNDELVKLGLPWATTTKHPMDSTVNPKKFYEITKDDRITITDGWPHKPDSYILISAGFDGIYGTSDDMFNFEK